MGANEIPLNGLTKDRIEDHNLTVMASRRANTEPLPGPLADAFAKGAIKVGDVSVRKVVASDWVALKQLKSPILEMILDLQQNAGNADYKPAEIEFSDRQQWELCWLFTHSPAETRKALADETFNDLVLRDIGDSTEQPVVGLIIAAVMEQLKRSWMTAIKYGEKAEQDGEITFFRDAEATRKMASDGGSSTSGG